MEQPYRFSVTLEPGLPLDQRESLLTALEAADVQIDESADRSLAAAVVTLLAVIGGVKTVAEAGSAVIKLAKELNEWRKASRAAGVAPNATLEAPGRPPLALATATDAQVLAWLLAGE